MHPTTTYQTTDGPSTAPRITDVFTASPDSGLSLQLRRRIYLSVAIPTGFYGMELLPLASNPAKAMVKRKQGRLLRQVLRVPWFIRTTDILKEFKLPDITQLAEKRRNQMISRYNDHLVQAIAEWGPKLQAQPYPPGIWFPHPSS